MGVTLPTVHVVAAIIVNNNEMVFATQRGYGTWKGYWEFPGGKLEMGETPQEALRREINEELATEIIVGELLTTIDYDYPTFHLTMQCYRCTLTGPAPTLLEHLDARWLTPQDLKTLTWLPADEELIIQLQELLL
ncbi:MAG: (deoxy)nucleoside triphosphate pyrophosphohydrolase [Bacteroidales bacterium]|nr:(deoxy)nucleoside triphosphate pyrophosphohydrolase [Bacteroidales bacterium]